MAKYLSLRRAKPCHTWQNIGKLYVGIIKLILLILSFPACSLPSQCSAVSWKQFCLANVAVTRSLHVVYHFLKRERPVQEIHFFPASLICMEPLLSPRMYFFCYPIIPTAPYHSWWGCSSGPGNRWNSASSLSPVLCWSGPCCCSIIMGFRCESLLTKKSWWCLAPRSKGKMVLSMTEKGDGTWGAVMTGGVDRIWKTVMTGEWIIHYGLWWQGVVNSKLGF